jgi:hypothetical protein
MRRLVAPLDIDRSNRRGEKVPIRPSERCTKWSDIKSNKIRSGRTEFGPTSRDWSWASHSPVQFKSTPIRRCLDLLSLYQNMQGCRLIVMSMSGHHRGESIWSSHSTRNIATPIPVNPNVVHVMSSSEAAAAIPVVLLTRLTLQGGLSLHSTAETAIWMLTIKFIGFVEPFSRIFWGRLSLCDRKPNGQAFSVHQKLLQLKIDVHFSEIKVFVSFPTPSRPYPQLLSIKWNNYLFFIQLRWLIFGISSLNIQLLKREVIPATRLRLAIPTRTLHPLLLNFSRSVMKIKRVLPGNYSQHHVVYLANRNCFVFFHIQGLHISANTLSGFRESIHVAWTTDFSFACIWCSDSLYISNVPYCTDVRDIHHFLCS